MRDIPLTSEPNQELSVRLDDHRFVLRFKAAQGCMAVDITVDDLLILSGSRVLASEPLIPFKFQEVGNFLLLTDNEDLPDYAQFGVTQSLVYLSADEIAAL